MYIKVSGTWKEIKPIYTKVSGTWKEIKEGHVKVNGSWKLFYKSFSMPENMVVFSKAMIAEAILCDGNNGTLNLIGRYLKVASSQGTTGGSATHGHNTLSVTSGSPTPLTRYKTTGDGDNGTYVSTAHTHSCSHGHGAVNSEPLNALLFPYINVTELTSDQRFFYYGGSAPSGWLYDSALVNRFVKGTDTAYSLGGASVHSHSASLTTGSGGSASGNTKDYSGQQSAAVGAHTHSNTHTHSNGVNEPAHYTLIPIYPDGATELPSGICAFFTGSTVPDGWSYFSAAEGRFIKMAATSGTALGSNTHSHSHSGNTGSGANGTAAGGSGLSLNMTGKSHIHTNSHTHTDGLNQPPFQELLFCKKD